jgi:hypothetical protein
MRRVDGRPLQNQFAAQYFALESCLPTLRRFHQANVYAAVNGRDSPPVAADRTLEIEIRKPVRGELFRFDFVTNRKRWAAGVQIGRSQLGRTPRTRQL